MDDWVIRKLRATEDFGAIVVVAVSDERPQLGSGCSQDAVTQIDIAVTQRAALIVAERVGIRTESAKKREVLVMELATVL
jgi:hypothetical protein